MNIAELTRLVQQNSVLKEEADRIATRQKELKTTIVEAVKELGEEDSKGHIVVDLPESVEGINKVIHQRRVSKSLDMDVAENVLKSKGVYDRCVKMIPVLDETEIMAAFYNGELTEQDIDSMFPPKTTWALVFNK